MHGNWIGDLLRRDYGIKESQETAGLEISAMGLGTRIYRLQENLKTEKITLAPEDLCSATEHMQAAVAR